MEEILICGSRYHWKTIFTACRVDALSFPCIPKNTVTTGEMAVSISPVSHNLNGNPTSNF